MSTIRKLEDGRWRCEVCVDGVRRSRRFATKRAAELWGIEAEDALKFGGGLSDMTLADAMEEYRQKVTPTKRGHVFEDRRLRFYEKDALAEIKLKALKVQDFEAFVSRRLTVISERTGRTLTRGTLSRDLNVISAVLHWAVARGYITHYPMAGFRWPTPEPHRERVASDEEIKKLCLVAGWDPCTTPSSATQMVAAAFCLACETGMRAGEIIAIESAWIVGRVLTLPAEVTKTQQPRRIPLSLRAVEILRLVAAAGNSPQIFGLATSTREALWNKIRNKAGLGEVRDAAGHVIKEALRFHDGRATFCTRAAKKISVMDLARITGHRDLKMLMKYYRPTAEELADKL